MKVREFNALKKQVKEGNVKRLKEAIGELTLKQAQAIEDLMYDLELTGEMNEVLDEVVNYIDSLVATEKVANKKAPAKTEPTKAEPTKEAPAKEAPAKEAPAKEAPANKVNVGDTVYFRVEGEEKQHEILIIYKGKTRIIGIMKEDEKEVFLIRKTDFNKLAFSWTDRHGEAYNIIVTL